MNSSSKRRGQAAAGSNCRHLPPEIVEEILCKLPVKSLNRFRCVSTSWQSLISDPRFIRKHFIRSAARLDSLFQKTLIHHEHLDSLPLSSLVMTSKRYLFDKVSAGLSTLPASCDGLLCIIDYFDMLYIWNPSMKLYRQICCSIPNQTYSAGLGYDSLRDDYKVVKLSGNWRVNTLETEIYSLKTDSWTKVDDFPRESLPIRYSVFANGAIHWLDHSPDSCTVVSFDLSENKYIEVVMPEDISLADNPINVRLYALRAGMLCVLIMRDDGLVLWGNKDFRDHKSWTRILAIPLEAVINMSCPSFKLEPLYVYENGEVLIGAYCGGYSYEKLKLQLLICKDGKVVFRQMTRLDASVIQLGGFVYMESLISPLRMDSEIEM